MIYVFLLIIHGQDRKNALEEYVYDTRGKLDDRYRAYVQQPEKEKLVAALQVAEDWLYTEEGEDATKSAYVTRLDALKVLGEPIANRYRENESRAQRISELRDSLNLYLLQATSTEEKYSHIDQKDKQSIVEKVATIQKWLDDQIARQSERPKNVDPVLVGADILKKKDEIMYFAIPIMSKPKPKPPKVDTPNAGTPNAGTPNNGTQTPQNGRETPSEQPPPPPKDGGPSEMDVD